MSKRTGTAVTATAEITGETVENHTGENTGETVENTETTGENTGETTGETTEETTEETTDGEQEKIRLVYVGPSLTYEKLRKNQILHGTEREIADFMAPIMEKYPEAAHLLVSVDKLEDAIRRTESEESILHKYYQDMLAKSRDTRKG